MTESLFLSVKVVVPLIVFMGIGYIVRHIGMVTGATLKELNNVVFKVFLSTMVFYNIYTSDLKQDFDLRLLVYAILTLLVMVAVLCLIIPRIIKDKSVAPVVIQGIYRSNFVLFGLQVTASICGSDNLGMATMLISIIIPMYNVIAVVLFETYRASRVNIKSLLKGIVTNPLIIASILGLISVGLGLQFGTIIDDTLKSISQLATPMSLIVLGGTMTVSGVRKYWKYSVTVSVFRLLVVPAVFLGTAVALGFRGTGLVALMVMYGSPTAVASFPMATSMGGNSEMAGQIVAVTTVFSVVTIFMWTYVLSAARVI
jgi:hypothetical protein